MVRVLILKSGAPHQSEAPSSEFKGGKSSKNQGRPISPRPHPRSSRVVRVLILKSGAPHQSQAPSSEFKGGKSSDLKIRGAPSVPGSILGDQGGKSSDFKIRGAPSVRGSILGGQGW